MSRRESHKDDYPKIVHCDHTLYKTPDRVSCVDIVRDYRVAQ